jgi:hypothetical protein
VSRHHCRLTRGGGGYTLEDLGSTNGTFVNGQRLMGARPLSGGDQVGLGETVTLSYESTVATAADFGARPQVPGQSPVMPPSPAQAGGYQPPASPYQPQVQTQVQPQPSLSPQQGYGAPPGVQQPYASVPPPQYPYSGQSNYQYDQQLPASGGAGRWFFIGCGCVIVLCVVLAVAAALYIDANDLYCSVPVVRELVGIIRRCP